jgi:very-short-patch-repair endonuclease
MRDEKGQFVKGHTPWHKGKTGVYSLEVIENIRRNNTRLWLGAKRPEISRAMRAKGLGKKDLYKYRPKDFNPVPKGSHLSDEHKMKIGRANKGKKRTEEQREKNRLIAKSIYRPKDFYRTIGVKGLAKQQTHHTSIEKIVYNFLLSQGIIFEEQKIINSKFIVDVYIPEFNLVIECDGEYWHSLEAVKKRDKAKNAYLTKCGFNLLRLKEAEINDGSFVDRLELKNGLKIH